MSEVYKISRRAKRLTLSVRPDQTVVMTRPRWVSERFARAFFEKHRAWVEQKLREVQSRKQTYTPHGSSMEYRAMKQRAAQLVASRLEYFNQSYGFVYHRISIRNPRTRWGSCSKKGNLNFSYKLLTLPPELADYIIVHELCHLKEFNHSKRFWELVGQTLPGYKNLRKQLRSSSVE